LNNSIKSRGFKGTCDGISGRYPFWRGCARIKKLAHFCVLVLGFWTIFSFPGWSHALAAIPGEEQAGIYYAVAHLPAAAYFILVFIFVLSVFNLWFQARVAGRRWPINPFSVFLHKTVGYVQPNSFFRQKNRRKNQRSIDGVDRRSMRFKQTGDFVVGSGVVGTPRLSENSESDLPSHSPTPLDGINHPMPQFSESSDNISISSKKPNDYVDSRPVLTEFKFSAAVDLPSPEEMERREKEQVTVSGSVKGPDGKGLSFVLVYLTDLEGNRIGQSCRSDPETGEFKVLANDAGKYMLKAHKRGLVLADQESALLPIESGKIEGYSLRMVPEGCVVQGKVLSRSGTDTVVDLEVQCVCTSSDFSRSARTDSDGFFSISGVPANSDCFLELYGGNGELLSRSVRFETVQKKEIYRELRIATVGADTEVISSEMANMASHENLPAEIPKQG
jgi:hypothetical protein